MSACDKCCHQRELFCLTSSLLYIVPRVRWLKYVCDDSCYLFSERRLLSGTEGASSDVVNMDCSSSHLLSFLLVTVTAAIILTLMSSRTLTMRRSATSVVFSSTSYPTHCFVVLSLSAVSTTLLFSSEFFFSL